MKRAELGRRQGPWSTSRTKKSMDGTTRNVPMWIPAETRDEVVGQNEEPVVPLLRSFIARPAQAQPEGTP